MRKILSILFVFVLMTFGLSAQTVATPTISPISGEFSTRVEATMSCATAGATLNYTLNGIDPTPLDPSIASGGTITLWRPQLLKVKAFKAGLVESAVASSSFYITGKVAAGNNHVAVLKSDRTVWSWGLNSAGQLGDGTTGTKSSPVQVKTNATTFLTTATDIASSANSTAALLANGTVVCWGWGVNGRLGNGLTTNQSYPVTVQKSGTTTSLDNVVAIAAGDDFHVALCSDGTVWSWGKGGIGTGFNADQSKATPVLLKSTGLAINGITQLAAGGTHLLMLSNTGSVFSTGSSNTNGQLGDNTISPQSTAIPVLKNDLTPLTGIADLAAGQNHSIAIDTLGAVYAWGLNSSYQLGDNTRTQRNTATLITGITGVVEAAGGALHTLFVKLNGELWACGVNATGALGIGTTATRTVPTKLTTIPNGVKVATRNLMTVVGKGDGTVVGFGENLYGNFGNGTMGSQWNFGIMTGASTVQKISARGSNSAFVKAEGTAWTVGANRSGQLSNGTLLDQATAIQAKNSAGNLTGITDVAQGGNHTLFLTSSGGLWAAGLNSSNQLGDNTAVTKNLAVPVLTGTTPLSLSGVTAIAAGGNHSLALVAGGKVMAWGSNAVGQLGSGALTNLKVATTVKASAGVDFTGVTAIAAQENGTILLRGSDQTVWVTGAANNGQLGNNTTSPNATYPVQVLTAVGVPLTGITAIAGGANHGLALRGSDGAVFAWGLNSSNQLGEGTPTQRNMAVRVKLNATTLLTGVSKIFAGGNSSGIIDSAGKFSVWGANTHGGLGDGTIFTKPYPTPVVALTGALQGAMGSGYTVAIKSDATVQSAGLNLYGQLGNGSFGYSLTPVTASGVRIINGEDADGDGVLSFQELLNGTDPDRADSDRDGVLDGVDTLPLDYYNGLAPVVAIVSGNNQSAFANELLPNPLVVSVKNSAGTALVNAPVIFTVTQGLGKIGATTATPTATTFVALTNSLGQAQFYWKLGATGTQTATAKAGSSATLALSGRFWVDTDADGMPDTWETSNFSNLTQLATDDFDNDGVKNIDEFKRGTNPKLATSKNLTFYVNQTGSDANSGRTTTVPLRTVGGAVARMLNGDITEVTAGEYRETKISPGTRNLILRPQGNVKVTP